MSFVVQIGNLSVGGNNPVRVQSMTNVATNNVEDTVNQVIELVDAGCELVRLTVRSVNDALLLPQIKHLLHNSGHDIPLVADVHFNPKVAEMSASIVEKVRINPGNYIHKKSSKTTFTDEDTVMAKNIAKANLKPLVEICKRNNTSLRVGSNHGSLSDRIIFKHGDTAAGMVASVVEFLQIFEELDFRNIVVSLKASNAVTMMEANRLFVEWSKKTGMEYPLHLGVTEAGSGQAGIIKSAVGIGGLLCEGIGDTIRVSLSEMPINEIAPAKILASMKKNIKHKTFDASLRTNLRGSTHALSVIISDDFLQKHSGNYTLADFVVTEDGGHAPLSPYTHANLNNAVVIDCTGVNLSAACRFLDKYFSDENYIPPVVKIYFPKSANKLEMMIKQAVELSFLIGNYPISGIWSNVEEDILADILQSMKIRLSKPEYISCPTCGRTCYDLISVVEDVKKKTSMLKDVTIGVMGCIVNGPGEMRGADYGVVGYGKNNVLLYKKGEAVGKPFPADEAADRLLELIDNDKFNEI